MLSQDLIGLSGFWSMQCNIAHINDYFDNQTAVLAKLREISEVSLASELSNSLAKMLIIASASYFEDCITTYVHDFVDKNSRSDMLREFFRIRAIERQYHTWFDWKSQNASVFFSLFGEAAKQRFADLIKRSQTLEQSVKDFIFLGSQRNLIAHKNLLNYPITDTPEEIKRRIQSASLFLIFMEEHIFETR
jgi:hypothetical protein